MDRIGSGTTGSYVDIIHCIGSFYRHFAYKVTEVYTEGLNHFPNKGLGDRHGGNGVALCIYLPNSRRYLVSFGIAACLRHIIGF